MRVVLSTYGSRGDVEPVVALAVRLREAGAEVRVCAPPDFAELVDGAGVPMTPVGWPVRPLRTGLLTDNVPTTLPKITGELAAMTYEAVSAVAEDGDVVVAAGVIGAQAGARAAAEQRGIPYTAATFATNFLPSPYHRPVPWPGQVQPGDESDNLALWELHATHLQMVFGGPINAHRAAIGLPPTDNIHEYVIADRPLLASDPVLGPWSATPTLDAKQTGAWIRPDHRPLPPALERFLEAGAAPVYVGFGSMPLRQAREVALAVITAVRAQGRRVVLARGWAELALVDERDDCFLVGEVNQQALFPRVAAVIHHGGAGTTTAAALAGAPQVIVPQVADQPYWAARVTAMGIGSGHGDPVPTAESLSAALDAALAPEVRDRAKAVAGTIHTDGTSVAANLLLDRVGRLPPRRNLPPRSG